MNVLHINQSYAIRGGVEVYVHQLQELLPKYNITSFFIAVSEPDILNRFKISGKDISIEQQSISEVQQFLTLYIDKNKIDLIHIHSVSNKSLIKFCLDIKPVVRSMHEPRIFCPGRQKFLLKSESICKKPFGLHCCIQAYTEKCQDSRKPSEVMNSYSNVIFEIKEASKKYKYIIAMSNYIKNEAVLSGISENKIIVNPYFTPQVNLTDMQSNNNDGLKHLVFVGRLHPSKGIHILIKSLNHILKNQHDVVLDIIGDGLFKNELLSLISLENIPTKKVVFHGWLSHSETVQKISEAYLVVFPSIYPEAFGIVGIEAMMYAKPVVAFDAGGVSTWLQNNVSGFLVDLKNEKIFADNVNVLLNDAEVYSRFSSNARRIALEKFIPEYHLNLLVELYKSEN